VFNCVHNFGFVSFRQRESSTRTTLSFNKLLGGNNWHPLLQLGRVQREEVAKTAITVFFVALSRNKATQN
jgi:hypothetical protein